MEMQRMYISQNDLEKKTKTSWRHTTWNVNKY